jgi:hypothetical protein|tara:strand:- start:175 stop:606 length:432 start_codon:yes stop_codon:yes gene_type:complete
MNWNIELGSKWRLGDCIDLDVLDRQATEEFNEGGRSSYKNTWRGLAAERILIENCGYRNDTRKYKDVYNPENVSTEVKTFHEKVKQGPDKYMREILDALLDRKKWASISEYVIFFSRNDREMEYTAHAMWEYDSRLRDYIEVA